ncbi:Hsp20/alpha crystallin family protein [Staphylococcus xylosus]|uniref:Hsp20/alpha crystallin family protein n=1 Tax=Staphylococcus xylosus TaxID=1288 RepID=UPI001559300A|nr:Hsp20/alpha crystallin family protein [Staphylococcus xylosus]NQD97192.1 Hsp20/alpha crystallin family protein [Staphylococcus xylosus]
MAFDKKTYNNPFFEGDATELFRDFGRQFFENFPETSSIKSDVRELDRAFIIEAELPGFKKENISLQFENDTLTIEGKRSNNTKEQEENVRILHQERVYSDVKRQYPFDNIDETAIKASFENGILNVTLPKKDKEEQSASNIQID